MIFLSHIKAIIQTYFSFRKTRMTINDYYGNKKGTTFLQIFTEPDDGSEKVIHRSLENAEAYDTWHLSYYFKEVLEYKMLMDRSHLDFSDLIRNEKNLLLYLLLSCDSELNSIMELGSSLYEMIDGFEVIQKYIRDNNAPLPILDISSFLYKGIELSQMLQLTSKVIHPTYKIKLYDNAEAFQDRADLLYDRSVTNYAYETVDELVDFVNRGKVGLLNTYFSYGDTFQTSRLGKTLTYFSLSEFLEKTNGNFFHLFGFKAPGPYSGHDISKGNAAVEGFFLYDTIELAGKFIDAAQQDQNVAQYFKIKEIELKPAVTLLR